jgi:hypothetical protein
VKDCPSAHHHPQKPNRYGWEAKPDHALDESREGERQRREDHERQTVTHVVTLTGWEGTDNVEGTQPAFGADEVGDGRCRYRCLRRATMPTCKPGNGQVAVFVQSPIIRVSESEETNEYVLF